ncbi:hypothetical protein O4J56_29215 [Nocardiopsis sp. RSe5-2]|uniref:HEAT repeat domain-containing protein n=1 Tax=Nocardiopsis endophytica TaxID=3018445 RepID=A0ABT4UEH7_9ACTN|nr:hypothetical protein [Nocardiopsis endophytica]MDA2814760.1 hypothetical protein [Nocardiopsis endophytica]
MSDHNPPSVDEDVLVMPPSWKRHLHPRRGGRPGPKAEAAGPSEPELRAPYAGRIEQALSHHRTDPALAAAARAHLDGRATPLGAAAVAAVPESELYSGDITTRFVDAWTTTYGLRFAVHAFLERCDIASSPTGTHKRGLVPIRDEEGLPDEYFDDHRLDAPAKRLRELLAVAPDDEYRGVVDLLAGLRTTPKRRVISAYLVPTEQHWTAECCAPDAPPVAKELLLRSLGSPAHLELLGAAGRLRAVDCYRIENLVTLADGVGPAVAPHLAEAFDTFRDEPRRRTSILEVLGRLPSDEAFHLMLERVDDPNMGAALRATMRLYPARAVRVLASAAADGNASAAELLTDHVRANAALADRLLPELSAEERATVVKLSDTGHRVPEASADELPRTLVDPPWSGSGRKAGPAPGPLKGVPVPDTRTVEWADGEREDWLRTEVAVPGANGVTLDASPPPVERDPVWERRIANIRDGVAVEPVDKELYWQAGILTRGPEELVRPVLREWLPDWRAQRGLGHDGPFSPSSWLRPLAARFELDALPAVLSFARAQPVRGVPLLLPFLDGEVAKAAAHFLLNVEKAQEAAAEWFDRHGAAAIPYLLPVALGKAGRDRTAAEYALHHLADQEGEDAVTEAARTYGDGAVDAVRALLDAPPRQPKATKVPTRLGVDAEVLPQVLLSGGERALPLPAVRNLLTLLAIAPPDGAAPVLALVLEACDGDSLAEFGWDLFRRWRENGAKPAYGWQFTALGRLGDDGTVRRLAPLIGAWPGEGGHRLAVRGLDVLARIGTEEALRSLRDIARTTPYKALKRKAQEKAEQVARVVERSAPGTG